MVSLLQSIVERCASGEAAVGKRAFTADKTSFSVRQMHTLQNFTVHFSFFSARLLLLRSHFNASQNADELEDDVRRLSRVVLHALQLSDDF